MSTAQFVDDEPEAQATAPAKPARGWPKGKPRGPRQEAQRVEARPVQRAEPRLKRPVGNNGNIFDYDKAKVPRGTSYEWKRVSVWGAEDREHQIAMGRYHWKPVPASRHPELAGPDGGDKAIIVRGQMLMERPDYLTDEAHQESIREARQGVRDKIKSLGLSPEGTMERTKPSLQKNYDLSVPSDAE